MGRKLGTKSRHRSVRGLFVLALLLLSLVTPTTPESHPHPPAPDGIAALAAEPLPHVTATPLPVADLPPVVGAEPPRGHAEVRPWPGGPAPARAQATALGARAPPSR
ncbi:hypothetical protein [Amycolatopsis methanolica]|uniref:Uncharacterized protein n=1 Tax=Amycolatopsis methanolica 239 TaxID=1068978 RepID=A0A076N620_AMYME|nr:hypothetical protein [Amycolatopsis methanolica]AIJ25447.1 hypothetical protein AMETH_5355 [Amycolatopsis methanolica 239]